MAVLTGEAAGRLPGAARGDGPWVDCLVSRRSRLPRDRMGHRLSESGRWLLIEAAAHVYGLCLSSGDFTRDEHRRWALPGYGLRASVAHCEEHSVVAFAAGTHIGVDLQGERDRPQAMRWLGELLGHPGGRPATIRDFVECEALIKASHVTKETFAGVRLPQRRPGWRPGNVEPFHIRSLTVSGGVHLALAAECPVPVRWWRQASRAEPPVRTSSLRLEAAL
jgi:hypothetical protein